MSVSEERAAAKKPIKVSQKTINDMKQMGMTKAIQQANSGNASEEFVEGARRMYGNRINAQAQKKPTPQTNRSIEQTRDQTKAGSNKSQAVGRKSGLNKPTSI